MREITNSRGIDQFRIKHNVSQGSCNHINKNDLEKLEKGNEKHNQLNSKSYSNYFEYYEKNRQSFIKDSKFNPTNYLRLIKWIDHNPYITDDEYSDYTLMKKKIDFKYLKFFSILSLFQTTGFAIYFSFRVKSSFQINKLLILSIMIATSSILTFTLNNKRLEYFNEEYEEREYLKELINMRYYM